SIPPGRENDAGSWTARVGRRDSQTVPAPADLPRDARGPLRINGAHAAPPPPSGRDRLIRPRAVALLALPPPPEPPPPPRGTRQPRPLAVAAEMNDLEFGCWPRADPAIAEQWLQSDPRQLDLDRQRDASLARTATRLSEPQEQFSLQRPRCPRNR